MQITDLKLTKPNFCHGALLKTNLTGKLGKKKASLLLHYQTKEQNIGLGFPTNKIIFITILRNVVTILISPDP